MAGLPVDVGPDAFLSRAPDLGELIARLGLTDDVVAPLPGGAFIWSRGRLHPIPQGAFGIPDRVVPLLRSGLLSVRGAARAGLDLVRPRTGTGADPSVGELVRPRLGDEVVDRLVQPLLGGVHAGSVDRLSARSAVPDVHALASSQRSLVLAMRHRRRAAPATSTPARPPLVSLEGGLSRLVDALVERLGPDRVVTSSPVSAVRPMGDAWLVETPTTTYSARTAVLAAPAHCSADLVAAFAPELAEELRGIEYVDVATVTLALPAAEVGDLVGTGFLVPPVEGAHLVGCTWLSSKWPHLSGHGTVLLRAMVGRDGDDRWVAMDDDELVAAVRADLVRLMGLTAQPTEVLVRRWPRAIPQYVVGHDDRLARIDRAVPDGLHLTGAAFRGSGLAACVGAARATAAAVAAQHRDVPERPTTGPEPLTRGARS